jgi:beta-fructofuranosidase
LPTLIYHGVPDGTCLATSSDDLLLRWTKHPANPVITPKKVRGHFAVYDPCAWKHGDNWFALCGRVDPAGGDTAFLFRSKDMVKWEYLHPFYKSERGWTEADEDCAVPDFFPLGDKHVLLFASHKRGGQYYVGRYANDRFIPERHGRLNWPGGSLIAPISLRDGKGRRVFFAWVNEQYREQCSRIAGWAGTLTLPRLLSLDGSGRLLFEPAPELAVLRMDHCNHPALTVPTDGEVTLAGIQGDSLEIAVEMLSDVSNEFGVKVRCSPDGAEQTVVGYCPKEKALKVDARRSSLDPDAVPLAFPMADKSVRVQSAPFELSAGEPLRLRLFLDSSILEVYANGRQCLTQRIYPSRDDSVQVRLFSRNGRATAQRIEAWRLGPAHD